MRCTPRGIPNSISNGTTQRNLKFEVHHSSVCHPSPQKTENGNFLPKHYIQDLYSTTHCHEGTSIGQERFASASKTFSLSPHLVSAGLMHTRYTRSCCDWTRQMRVPGTCPFWRILGQGGDRFRLLLLPSSFSPLRAWLVAYICYSRLVASGGFCLVDHALGAIFPNDHFLFVLQSNVLLEFVCSREHGKDYGAE